MKAQGVEWVGPILLLSRAPLFQNLNEEVLQEVLRYGKGVRIKSGRTFFSQEDPAENVFLLLEGRVKILHLTEEGQQIFMRLINPGGLFGIVGLIGGQGYPANAIADRSSYAICWDRDTLKTLIQRHSSIGLNAIGVLSTYIKELQSRFSELATQRVERRLARTLLRLLSQVGKKDKNSILLDMALSRQDLAEMTGTTLFTCSRILTQWSRAKIVSLGREKIRINQPHQLVMIAEEASQPAGTSNLRDL